MKIESFINIVDSKDLLKITERMYLTGNSIEDMMVIFKRIFDQFENKEVFITWQEQQLLVTLLEPIAEDEDNSSYTKKVSVNLLLKLRE
jgi:hypothetical protein